jgi:PAS domain S-box-containing protein
VDDWQYRRLVESINDYAIYMLDRNGVVISWNAGAERFKGYLADEVVGRNFALFYTPEDQAKGEPQAALHTASRQGRFECECWCVRKGGARFWANVVIEPMREDGRIVGFAKVTRDLSEKKEAERTLDRMISALNQSHKMEAFGQMTGGLAHDFGNVLSVILGNLDLIRKSLPRDPAIDSLLDNAVEGARRGSALTHRMMAFGRRQDLVPQAVHLPSLIRGMLTLLGPALGPKVTLETHFPSRHNAVFIDANQLEMAVLNLAVNARDAMPTGGKITITVHEERLAPGQVHGLSPGAYACLSVQDTGVGMDAATLSRAMEPFYTTKEPGRGTGLGLSMVHGLAIQAGGCLLLTSEIGKGAFAELWLPLSEAA